MTSGNLEVLERLLADDLSYTHSTGIVESRSQYLDALRSGRVRYRAARREVDRLSTYDGCAVMQGRLTVQAELDGQSIVAKTLFTATWVRQAAGWQLAAWAATPNRPGPESPAR
ncbi:MAG TPA: nuclear transport factor 2 family protein [Burkholderiaceae bacterium]|nr:nuclear transport factor 2 family protein [Burkholderiaceae bacterium]